MRLLQSTWAELLTLTTAFRSLEQFAGQGGDGGGGGGGSDIDSVGGVGEENGGCSLRLRYATDYWLDERLAKECCSVTVDTMSSSNGSTTATTTTGTLPTVMDIYNLVSIIPFQFFSITIIIM